jgi:hypothetical protein
MTVTAKIKTSLLLLFLLLSKAATFTAVAGFPSRLEWQDNLLRSALPLPPTPLSQALSTLQRDGVVRIDGRSASVDPLLCANLRRKILAELAIGDFKWESNGNTTTSSSKVFDKKYVPGTRLRFGEPIDISFGGNSRHDLLLPLTNPDWPELQPVLKSAVRQLQPLLVDAVERMLPRLYGSTAAPTRDEDHDNNNNHLEIVELGSLINRPGSVHQNFHGDYRRFHQPPSPASGGEDDATTCNTNTVIDAEPLANTQARRGKLPPRLVMFVALQDIPTKEHGATGFVTGTNTAQAHAYVYEGQGIGVNDDSDLQAVAAATTARQSILSVSLTTARGVVAASQFQCGDILVYDASVLHWGGANSVLNNDRAILYFGVARPGAAAMLSSDEENEGMVQLGFQVAPPVLLQDVAASPV